MTSIRQFPNRIRRADDMIQVAALSDVGCKRTNNEDSFGFDVDTGIYVVSDGMGGSAAGEIASHVAVEATLSSFKRMLGDAGIHQQPMQHTLYYAMLHANTAVYQQACANAQYAGMGATLVALCIHGYDAVIANIGDSRAYLLRSSQASAITVDHSLGAEQVRNGYPLPDHDPSFNIITRAVGIGPDVTPDLFAARLQPGDCVLLASDGLMKHLDDASIARIAHNAPTVEEMCSRLIESVKALGATDNVTCLAVRVS